MLEGSVMGPDHFGVNTSNLNNQSHEQTSFPKKLNSKERKINLSPRKTSKKKGTNDSIDNQNIYQKSPLESETKQTTSFNIAMANNDPITALDNKMPEDGQPDFTQRSYDIAMDNNKSQTPN